MAEPLELQDKRRIGKFNLKSNFPVMSEIDHDNGLMSGLEGGEMHLNCQGYLEYIYDPEKNELLEATICEE